MIILGQFFVCNIIKNVWTDQKLYMWTEDNSIIKKLYSNIIKN